MPYYISFLLGMFSFIELDIFDAILWIKLFNQSVLFCKITDFYLLTYKRVNRYFCNISDSNIMPLEIKTSL